MLNGHMEYAGYCADLGQDYDPADYPKFDPAKWEANSSNDKCYNFACDLHFPENNFVSFKDDADGQSTLMPGSLHTAREKLDSEFSSGDNIFGSMGIDYCNKLAQRLHKDGHFYAGNEELNLHDDYYPIAAFAVRAEEAGLSQSPSFGGSGSARGGMVQVMPRLRVSQLNLSYQFHFYGKQVMEDPVSGSPKMVWAQKAGVQPAAIVQGSIFQDAMAEGYRHFAGFWMVDRKRMIDLQHNFIHP